MPKGEFVNTIDIIMVFIMTTETKNACTRQAFSLIKIIKLATSYLFQLDQILDQLVLSDQR